MTQSHAPSIWRERAGSGAVPSVKRGVLVGAPVVMAFEWNYGDPLPAGLVFTGDANRTKLDATGKVVPVAANVPRNDGYVYDKNGLLVPGWLIEGARTNSILRSRDLTNAAWSKTVTAALDTPGVDGTANSATTITDSSAAAAQSASQNVTVPVDSNTHAVQYWILKDSNTTRFPGLEVDISGGTLVQRLISFNTATGAFQDIANTGTSTVTVKSAGLWWIVSFTVTNNGSALNTSLVHRFYPALGATLGGNSVTPTGSIVIGHVQTEINAAFSSSPVFTTSAAVTRAAEVAYVPWMYWPQLQTVYLKGLNLGTAQIASTGYAEIGNNTESMLIWDNSGVLRVTHRIGATLVQADNGAAPVVGDNYEIRAVLNANGSVQSGQSINAAAETLSGVSATNATTGAWGIPRLYLNAGNAITSGFFAFQSFRLALGASAWSMDQMRKVAPETGAFMFSDAGTPAASLVGDPVNGYDISDSNLTGTGRIAVLGASGITEVY